jgi:hypothetical protein
LVEWLILLKTKLLKKNLKWKPSCFIVNDVPQELQTLWWVLFSLYLSLNFYVHATISKFHYTFFIINNVISWNYNKLIFYAWLRLCGVRINCPFIFAHNTSYKGLVLMFDGKNQRQWGATCNIGWLSHRHVHAHWTRWKKLKPSWFMGEIISLKVSPNICLMIHGLNTFGPISSKLVHELILNPLLLFHHVVHIQKYSLLELM